MASALHGSQPAESSPSLPVRGEESADDPSALRRDLALVSQSEHRFRVLSELTNDYCYVARFRDARPSVEWLCGAISRITGYTEQELGDAGVWSIVSPVDEGPLGTAVERVRQGETIVHEFRIRTKAGDERWMREHLRPERDADGQLVVYGAARDVTERHFSQLEQEHLEAQLRQSQKMDAVGRLAGGVAHDFNNLLTVIITHCGFLLADLPPHTQAHDDASHIQLAARRAAELTQRLLAFSRQQVLTPKVLDLNVVLRELEPVLLALLGEGIELETALHPAALRLKVDRAQLEQIILNLVVNARDAMPAGGKLQIVTDQVELSADYVRAHAGASEGPHIALGVRDTGVGMSEDVLARIFEPFFTTKEQGKGTGLGLSTVYGIVQQSGGSIAVESQVGFGTTFEIFFRPAGEGERRDPTVRPPRELAPVEANILVVEDEEGVRRGVQRILKHAGYQVLVAADPAQAIAIVEDYEGTLDLLLTDIVMPMMTGAELALRVRSMRRGIRVLYMSGHAREALDSQQVSEQGAEFLQKPFTRQSLLAKVRSVLAPDD